MKPSKGILNPYAESYVPLCNREVVSEETKDFKLGESAAWSSQHDNMYNVPFVDMLVAADNNKLKTQHAHGYYSSVSQHAYGLSEKQIMDEKLDMDITFLQMSFPGISDESLSDAYAVNHGDVEATFDMLKELEIHADFSDRLPDTLDIGDVSEPSSSTELATKLKVGEGGPSSSGSS